jgi:hypothetical protein
VTAKVKPRFIEPMLLLRTEMLPEGPEWGYEVKLDGYRVRSTQGYYDRHLDPNKTPREEGYEALGAIQKAERSFDKRLKDGFGPAILELEDLG